jgi:hypothetical protein
VRLIPRLIDVGRVILLILKLLNARDRYSILGLINECPDQLEKSLVFRTGPTPGEEITDLNFRSSSAGGQIGFVQDINSTALVAA